MKHRKVIATILSLSLLIATIPTVYAVEVEDLIEAQEKTENSAVYGEALSDNIGHIDGPIEVIEVQDSTTINYNPGQGGDSEKDSYIGSAAEDVVITTNDNIHGDETILVGPDVEVGEESGTANHSPKEVLTEEQVEEKNQEIRDTLDEIAAVGDELIQAGESNRVESIEDLIQVVKDTNKELKESGEGDSFVIDLNGNVLSSGNNYDSLNKEISGLIYNNTNKNDIIVNVYVDPELDKYTISLVEMNRNYQSYDPLANFLYWNFGGYAGEITIEKEWGGVILAPHATVNLSSGIHSGRVVATITTTGGEIHTSVGEHTPPETVPPTTEPEPPEATIPPTETEPTIPETTEPIPEPSTTPNHEHKPSGTQPKTGDSTNLLAAKIMLVFSLAGMLLVIYNYKKDIFDDKNYYL